MTILTCANTGKSITLLGEPIANSGEGKIWRTNNNSDLAKIYHSFTPERVQKLEVMIAHPPQEPNSHLNHISFAWPKSILKNSQGEYVGFLMPEIKNSKQLIDIYNPQRYKKQNLKIDWRFLHITAQNIASIVAALHANCYVLGDIKPPNILVNNRALPSIIDTDSFQIRHPKNGKIYLCPVGSPDYTPPELINEDFSSIYQTEVHDRFRLAVIIYQLLFAGQSPFSGKWIGTGETPESNELIRRGLWLYSPNSLLQAVDRTIPLEIVHPEIQRCFLRCFNDGHHNPRLRPSATEWLQALKVACSDLSLCGRVDSHYYSRIYGKCYWCDRSTKLGVDTFPGNLIYTPSIPQPISNSSRQSPTTAQQILSSQGYSNTVSYVSFSPDGKTLASRVDKTINIWSLPQKATSTSQNLKNGQKTVFWIGVTCFLILLILTPVLTLTIVQYSSSLNSVHNIDNNIIGIGILFQIDEKTKIPTITEVIENSPADRGYLKVGDQILEVNGKSTLNMSATDVANLIKGDINSKLFLQFRRSGFRDITIMLVREKIIIPNL